MTEISIRRIQEDEIPEFRELALREIGAEYADIDKSFADIIVQAHQHEQDPFGYFTKTKTIWTGLYEKKIVGYLVGTEKRGGSVKFSPILIKGEKRRQGFGTLLWREVEAHYRSKGHRKVYTHAPWSRKELYHWFSELGYSLEGILAEQYDRGQDEFVMGKFLEPPPDEVPNLPQTSSIDTDSDRSFTVRRFEEGDAEQFMSLINDQMAQFYEEVGTEFAENILKARNRFDKGYKAKGKAVFVVESGGNLLGCCVGSPKRGGSVKLVPFIFTDGADSAIVEGLLSDVVMFFTNQGYRKVYSLVPHLQTGIIEILRHENFNIEGLIRAPYKHGVDNVFLGKFLEET